MAITFYQQPPVDSIQSSDNPLTYVFGSNVMSLYRNFVFVVSTYINGTLVSTDLVYPEAGNRAHFDASSITCNYPISPDRTTGLVTIQTAPTVKVTVSERYGTLADPIPTTKDPFTSFTCRVVKACCSEEDFKLNWLTDKYTPSMKWLTDAPYETMYVSRKYPLWASILSVSPSTNATFTFYDSDNVVIYTHNYSSMLTGQRIIIQLTPANISALIAPVDLSAVAKIEVNVNGSNTLTFIYITEECGDFNQISWLNNFAGYEQSLFTHNSEHKLEISGMQFKTQFGNWEPDKSFVYDTLESGDTTYTKTMQGKGTIYSGWITEQNRDWLNDMFSSVSVLLLTPKRISKVSITDTQTLTDKVRFEDLINFQVNYIKSNFKSITS